MLVNKRPEQRWAGETGPAGPLLMASVSCPDFRALAGVISDPTGTPQTGPGVAVWLDPVPRPGSCHQIVSDLRLAVALPRLLMCLHSPSFVVECLREQS